MAGAFGHRIEFLRKETVGLVRELLVVARAFHQDGDKVDVLEARAFDVLANGAVADQAEAEGHDRRCSAQRAQAIKVSSERSGPTSCTESGRPNGPAPKGRAMHGTPSSV